MIAGLAELVLLFWRIPSGKEMHVVLIVIGMPFYLIGDAWWYAIVSSDLPSSGEPPGSWRVTYGSLLMFVVAAVVTSYCARLSGTEE